MIEAQVFLRGALDASTTIALPDFTLNNAGDRLAPWLDGLHGRHAGRIDATCRPRRGYKPAKFIWDDRVV
jgi:hypothetical protein